MSAGIDAGTRADARMLWDFHEAPAHEGGDRPADVVLALGSHDLRVAEYAGRMWAEGAAPLLILSGNRGRRTSGGGGHARWERSEAEEFADVARETAGVPEAAMLLERRATNTGENFAFGRALAAGHGLDVRSAVVTAKPYMGRRALATAAVHWPGVQWAFRCFSGGYDGYPDGLRSEVELVHFLVGDLQRLTAYADRGWSAPVPIPDEVRAACARLIARGFTDHAVAPETPRP